MSGLMVMFLFISTSTFAKDSKKNSNQDNLRMCRNKALNVAFLCDPQWKMQTIDDAVLVVIDSDPTVTLIIAKIDSHIQFLSQMSKPTLENLDQYADGFRLDRIKRGGKDYVEVKAFAKDNIDKRILDYYMVHDLKLYGVLFSVTPKENWDKYKFLIQEIKDSFKFVDG